MNNLRSTCRPTRLNHFESFGVDGVSLRGGARPNSPLLTEPGSRTQPVLHWRTRSSTQPPEVARFADASGRWSKGEPEDVVRTAEGPDVLPGRPVRVLVTGGSGLIGCHLTKRLLASGHQVLVVDDFSTSTRANLAEVQDHPRLQILEHDVVNPLFVEVDQIYHLACPASPVHYQRTPVKTMKTCVQGSINMLGLARRTGASILLSSTSEIYGDPTVHPQDESYWGNVNPIGPRSCYDEGKRSAEALFFSYRRQYDVAIKVARIFNTYGPNMQPDDGRVVSNFIVQALRGRALPLFGDGSQTRSFCYVDDLVDGLIRLMNTPGVVTGPTNFGNPDEYTMLELAKLVIDTVGSNAGIEYLPLPEDDPQRRRPSVEQAQAVLGWRPSTALADSLVRTVEYFRTMGY